MIMLMIALPLRSVTSSTSKFQDCFVASRCIFLREKSHCGRFLDRYFPFVRGSLAQDQGKQCRFSGAIRTDQSDAIAAIYLERRIFKKRAAGKGFCDLGNREHKRAANVAPNPAGASVVAASSCFSDGSRVGCGEESCASYTAALRHKQLRERH